jgi:hypothetical protein
MLSYHYHGLYNFYINYASALKRRRQTQNDVENLTKKVTSSKKIDFFCFMCLYNITNLIFKMNLINHPEEDNTERDQHECCSDESHLQRLEDEYFEAETENFWHKWFVIMTDPRDDEIVYNELPKNIQKLYRGKNKDVFYRRREQLAQLFPSQQYKPNKLKSRLHDIAMISLLVGMGVAVLVKGCDEQQAVDNGAQADKIEEINSPKE